MSQTESFIAKENPEISPENIPDTKKTHKVVDETKDSISEQPLKAITSLDNTSTNIGNVLTVIRTISEQTNLLALNAAIEAARAGENGAGFAVVADEIRVLAQRTQDSTKEIESFVALLQVETEEASLALKETTSNTKNTEKQIISASESLEKIASAITTISEINSQIASAAEQQSIVSDDINTAALSIEEQTENTTKLANKVNSYLSILYNKLGNIARE
ncbi:methyl-accepting chemotaxis protein [Thalassomonas sp. RHCl1]|uniref:methyl-accepting chemotaxis protein n=1 Tax=Thalassomonas sp. RHCl1 TaxID=2995320 RepID=UPI00248C9BDC|nr:methyl-accepting chemotaxis protein [Thalassomonas sp. RHCl1]